ELMRLKAGDVAAVLDVPEADRVAEVNDRLAVQAPAAFQQSVERILGLRPQRFAQGAGARRADLDRRGVGRLQRDHELLRRLDEHLGAVAARYAEPGAVDELVNLRVVDRSQRTLAVLRSPARPARVSEVPLFHILFDGLQPR